MYCVYPQKKSSKQCCIACCRLARVGKLTKDNFSEQIQTRLAREPNILVNLRRYQKNMEERDLKLLPGFVLTIPYHRVNDMQLLALRSVNCSMPRLYRPEDFALISAGFPAGPLS